MDVDGHRFESSPVGPICLLQSRGYDPNLATCLTTRRFTIGAQYAFNIGITRNFMTVCTANREMILGTVSGDDAILSWVGEIVQDEWLRSDTIRSEVRLDEFVIMPNHFHAIVWIAGATSLSPLPRGANGPTPRSLSSLMVGSRSPAPSGSMNGGGHRGSLSGSATTTRGSCVANQSSTARANTSWTTQPNGPMT
jgi:hypothetical protein